MITPDGEITVKEDERGIYFVSDNINLATKPLSVPCLLEKGTGVMEFFERKVIWHPANGNDREMTAQEFLEILDKAER